MGNGRWFPFLGIVTLTDCEARSFGLETGGCWEWRGLVFEWGEHGWLLYAWTRDA